MTFETMFARQVFLLIEKFLFDMETQFFSFETEVCDLCKIDHFNCGNSKAIKLYLISLCILKYPNPAA